MGSHLANSHLRKLKRHHHQRGADGIAKRPDLHQRLHHLALFGCHVHHSLYVFSYLQFVNLQGGKPKYSFVSIFFLKLRKSVIESIRNFSSDFSHFLHPFLYDAHCISYFFICILVMPFNDFDVENKKMCISKK